ncbi:hypothetical protein BJ138DRAFT_1105730 [Hygrophoropsis aurantiaca]|uniref:Uncharacterized protein n=1 Tax=Hygrophoropsis aurantiaca TaxID=72124 RepID=A0ACB7ZYL0_9AGAM|nr:hypothetical protein BJ138DRAFT_1105730 [Hygrophoropsis aurantiaca]
MCRVQKSSLVADWKTHKLLCKALKNSPGMLDMDDCNNTVEDLMPALQGKHAPPDQRLVLVRNVRRDPDSKKVMAFAGTLTAGHIFHCAHEKFQKTGEKGAVIFNVNYPLMETSPPSLYRLF